MKLKCGFCNRPIDTLHDNDFNVKVTSWKNDHPVCTPYHFICWEMKEPKVTVLHFPPRSSV